MANTFTPSEQACEKVSHKHVASGDNAVVRAAQEAYDIGTVTAHAGPSKVIRPEQADSSQHPKSAKDDVVEITPLFKQQPHSNTVKMAESAGNINTEGKTDKSGWGAYEALELGVKKALHLEPQSNSNAMKGSEGGEKTDKSGWGAYEALELGVKKFLHLEPQSNSNAMRGSEIPEPQSNSNAMRGSEIPEPQSNSNAMRGSEMGAQAEKSGWAPYDALNLDVKKRYPGPESNH